MLWEPAIYEHKAALIGKSPYDVSRSADLLVDAVRTEFRTYRADYLTVGLDVYNIEAEAMGAEIVVPGENECPDIARPLFDLAQVEDYLDYPDIPGSGRFDMLLEAGQRVTSEIGDAAKVRIAASGPVTIAAKLVGLDSLVMSLALGDGNARELLEFTNCIAADWCEAIRDAGLDAVIFDSMAAPPMFGPDMYRDELLKFHWSLMWTLQEAGQKECELVIGGDTTVIAAALDDTHASMIVCDYAADAQAFAKALPFASLLRVRRNINPAILLQTDNLDSLANEFAAELSLFDKPVAGTGILPYDFPSARLLEFRRAVDGRIA